MNQSTFSSGAATNILFAFLNGEAFDYIGSSRMVYDITEKAFPEKVEEGDLQNGHQPPLELSNVKEIITLGQLYNRDGFFLKVKSLGLN